ncbi:hypothetical protein [Streptomyces sp. NPDC005009]
MPEPIKKLPPDAKGQVRYRFVVDAGTDPETGKRKQLRLNRAVTRGLVTVDVTGEVRIPLKARKAERKTKEVVQPWNASEVGAFVAAMKSDRLFAPLLLSLMGLRPAEVCGLRWSDIDLDTATLGIANTRTMVGNRTVVGEGHEEHGGGALNGRQLRTRAYKTMDANSLR